MLLSFFLLRKRESNPRPQANETCELPTAPFRDNDQAVSGIRGALRASCEYYLQQLHCLIRRVCISARLNRALPGQMKQEGRVAGFWETIHAGQKCIGWVVVEDAQPVQECTRVGRYLFLPRLNSGPTSLAKCQCSLVCGKGEIRTPGVSYVLDLQSSAHPPSEQPSRCGSSASQRCAPLVNFL